MLHAARERYARRAWSDAAIGLAASDAVEPLAPDDLERLAIASYLIGQDGAAGAAMERAHDGFLASEAPDRAACVGSPTPPGAPWVEARMRWRPRGR